MMVNHKRVDHIAFLREKHPCLGKKKIKPLIGIILKDHMKRLITNHQLIIF